MVKIDDWSEILSALPTNSLTLLSTAPKMTWTVDSGLLIFVYGSHTITLSWIVTYPVQNLLENKSFKVGLMHL